MPTSPCRSRDSWGDELLGHRDVAITQIHTHVLNRGPSGVKSPIDTILGA